MVGAMAGTAVAGTAAAGMAMGGTAVADMAMTGAAAEGRGVSVVVNATDMAGAPTDRRVCRVAGERPRRSAGCPRGDQGISCPTRCRTPNAELEARSQQLTLLLTPPQAGGPGLPDQPLRRRMPVDMLLCMRTTIDMPNALMKRVKAMMATRNVTFRALVIDALEQLLGQETPEFHLRDAAAGMPAERDDSRVSARDINEAIDQQRRLAWRE